MPEAPASFSRSKTELLRGAWRLPAIAARLALDSLSLFVLKTPVPRMLERIVLRPSRAEFHPPTPAERARLAQVWRVATLCLNYLFFSAKPCLRRCLLLLAWCRKRGVRATLVIGVAKHGAELKGHSWIELEGMAVHENPAHLKIYRPLITASSQEGLTFHSQPERDTQIAFSGC